MITEVRQRQAGDKKQSGKYCRGARQERRRTTCAEYGARCARTKSCTRICALATLDQDQRDNAHREKQVNNHCERIQPIHDFFQLAAS